jgi:hypothetical protein
VIQTSLEGHDAGLVVEADVLAFLDFLFVENACVD